MQREEALWKPLVWSSYVLILGHGKCKMYQQEIERFPAERMATNSVNEMNLRGSRSALPPVEWTLSVFSHGWIARGCGDRHWWLLTADSAALPRVWPEASMTPFLLLPPTHPPSKPSSLCCLPHRAPKVGKCHGPNTLEKNKQKKNFLRSSFAA